MKFRHKPFKRRLKNREIIERFYKAERRRVWLVAGPMLASFILMMFLITFPLGDKSEVIAVATPANVSYRSKSHHKQQVALKNGQLIMVNLPHQITLVPGQRIVLAEHNLVALGLKRYHFISLLSSEEGLAQNILPQVNLNLKEADKALVKKVLANPL